MLTASLESRIVCRIVTRSSCIQSGMYAEG